MILLKHHVIPRDITQTPRDITQTSRDTTQPSRHTTQPSRHSTQTHHVISRTHHVISRKQTVTTRKQCSRNKASPVIANCNQGSLIKTRKYKRKSSNFKDLILEQFSVCGSATIRLCKVYCSVPIKVPFAYYV